VTRVRAPGIRSSQWIRSELRWSIYARDEFRCVWRGCECTRTTLTLDHIFPVGSRFRDNDPRRLVTACVSCNTSRKAMRLKDWLRSLTPLERAGALLRLRSRRRPILRAVGRFLYREFVAQDKVLMPALAAGTPGLGADGNLY
jgi:hypothetical protein